MDTGDSNIPSPSSSLLSLHTFIYNVRQSIRWYVQPTSLELSQYRHGEEENGDAIGDLFAFAYNMVLIWLWTRVSLARCISLSLLPYACHFTHRVIATEIE